MRTVVGHLSAGYTEGSALEALPEILDIIKEMIRGGFSGRYASIA
jgi:hypothetical protein